MSGPKEDDIHLYGDRIRLPPPTPTQYSFLLCSHTVSPRTQVLDLFLEEWPGNGAAVLLTSQCLFAIHNTPDILGVIMIVIAIFTFAIMMVGWRNEKHIYRAFYPQAMKVAHAL